MKEVMLRSILEAFILLIVYEKATNIISYSSILVCFITNQPDIAMRSSVLEQLLQFVTTHVLSWSFGLAIVWVKVETNVALVTEVPLDIFDPENSIR